MPAPLVECVPNFSEGRDTSKIDRIAKAVAAEASLLDRTSDADHNRSVLTFAGSPDAVARAAVRAVTKAAELIDLRTHVGAHPRIGAADVVPFVPLAGISMEECAALAERVGNEIWTTLGVPVYLYEAAARSPERRDLARIRRGGLAPDIGGPALHPTAGATVVGARKILVAYNINLATDDVAVAKRIAKKVRASSGGLPAVKALGIRLERRGLVQVSMNLTDFEQTPVRVVWDAVTREAALEGVGIAGSELIGLAPAKALEGVEGFGPDAVLENRISSMPR